MTTRKTTHNADPTITDLLKVTADKKADSLHLTVGAPPSLRFAGRREPLEAMPLTVDQLRKLLAPVLPPAKQQELEDPTSGFTSSMFGVKGLARFQLTAYFQRGAPAAVIKRLPFEPPIAPAWLAPAFDWMQPGAFVIVAGKAGTGRSTTLAMLIDHLNTTKRWHITTLEDPIAYVFPHKESVIDQLDLEGPMPIENGIRIARTTAPDAVMVAVDDELRTASEIVGSGALTIASLTINDARSAADVIRRVLLPSQLVHVPGIVWLTRPGEGRLVQLAEL